MGTHQGGSSGAIGFFGALAILFIGLKLGRLIDWPWVWVLAPLWVPRVIASLVFAVMMAVLEILEWREDRRHAARGRRM